MADKQPGKFIEVDMKIVEVGLCDVPAATYLFIGGADDNEGQHPWYKYNHLKKAKEPVEETALTGFLTSLKVIPKAYKGKVNYKLDIFISGDKPLPYVIRSGINTAFTRGFILAMSKVPEPSDLITIIPEAGDTGNTVFCKLLYSSEFRYIKNEWNDKVKLFPLIREIQGKLPECPIQEWKVLEEEGKKLLTK